MASEEPIWLPVTEYSPDMPDFENPGSDVILNCIPATPNSYGPAPSFASFGGSLSKRCQGASTLLSPVDNVYIFAGDIHDLYLYNSSNLTPPLNVSSTSGVYNTPPDGRWFFTQMGSRAIATNFNDPIQTFTMDTSSKFATLAAAAPKAMYCDIIKNFLVVANTNDPTNGFQPQRVWWSAVNDPTNWPTPGTAAAAIVQSSFNDLLGPFGQISGVVGDLGNADGAVFMEKAIWRMMYAGPPAVFDFSPAEGARGTRIPGSLIKVGFYVYYIADNGFYVFDGTSSIPIGVNKVDKTFFATFDGNYLDRVVGSHDPQNKCVYWDFPSTAAINGNPDTRYVFNYVINKWSVVQISAEMTFQSLSLGYTLDTMPGPLDSLLYPLDSRVWTGGNLVLGGFNTTHTFGYYNGPNLQATIDTTENEGIKGKMSFINNARPYIDGGTSSISIAARNRLVDIPIYGPSYTMNSIGNCPLRSQGRYFRARSVVPAGDSWSHFQGVHIYGIPLGDR